MADVEQLTFIGAQPDFFIGGRNDWEGVQALRHEHFKRVLTAAGRTAEESRAFVESTESEAWIDPNQTSMRGRYARPYVVMASDQSYKPVLISSVADSASATERFPFRLVPDAIQERAKLNWESLLLYRPVRMLETVVSNEYSEDDALIAAVNIIAMLRLRSGMHYDQRQPVVDYPYEEETELMERDQSYGMQLPSGEEPEKVPAAWADNGYTFQYHLVGESIGVVATNVLQTEAIFETYSRILDKIVAPKV